MPNWSITTTTIESDEPWHLQPPGRPAVYISTLWGDQMQRRGQTALHPPLYNIMSTAQTQARNRGYTHFSEISWDSMAQRGKGIGIVGFNIPLPIIRGVQRRRRNFRKDDWASYTLATERSILLIPVNNVSVEESYQRFCGAMLSLLPSLKSSGHYLRELGHPYELPTYQYSFSRATFVIRSLYNFFFLV